MKTAITINLILYVGQLLKNQFLSGCVLLRHADIVHYRVSNTYLNRVQFCSYLLVMEKKAVSLTH